MVTLTCDVCKKSIPQPVASRNFFHLARRDLCEACHNDLEAVIKPIIRTKRPFKYEWFHHLVQDSIENAIQRGSF